MKEDIPGRVTEIASAIASPLGLDVLRVDFVKESNHRVLRVFLKSPDAVKLADCEKVARTLSKKLDEIDIIKESYYLEVSSPGTKAEPGVDDSKALRGTENE